MTAEPSSCTVWWLAAPFDAAPWLHLLDAPERVRWQRYRFAADRDRFALGAAVVRCAVAATHGMHPEDVLVDRSCPECGAQHGRPIVDAPSEVSVSHSGELVVVATTGGERVGVDVEQVRTAIDDLLPVACAPEERARIVDAEGFARVWARKEAVLKALGVGLRRDPSTAVMSAPDEPPRLRRLDGREPPACRLHDLDLRAGHAGAVAVLTDRALELTVRPADALLEPDARR